MLYVGSCEGTVDVLSFQTYFTVEVTADQIRACWALHFIPYISGCLNYSLGMNIGVSFFHF